ncbi:hypothetical protein AX766_07025 [Flavobacterium covae]|nr:hypothetical protein AX766_06980 [Flavobacterium covae]AND64181.1 hypothetical protein AX766_07025 [Flavobacterium covae]
MHDPRVGRFFAIDPLFRDYPWNSPYAFSENRVMDMVELEGLEAASTADKQNPPDGMGVDVKTGELTPVKPMEEVVVSAIKRGGDTYKLVSSYTYSKGDVYKHVEKTTTKHFWGLLEDHGNQGYDITYDTMLNVYGDGYGNYTSSLEYKVTSVNPTWHSSASNFEVYKFGLTSLAAAKVLQVAFAPRVMTGMETAISLSQKGFAQGATAQLTMSNGKYFVGISSGVKSFQLTEEMTGILMNAGRTGSRTVPPWFGGCAEVSAIQQARAAGYTWSQIRSGTFTAYNIGGVAGSIKPFCPGCLNLFEILPK